MEKERDIVAKRIERMERKVIFLKKTWASFPLVLKIYSFQVEGTPNSERMLDVAKKLRLEKEKERELQSQKQEQRNAIQVTIHSFSSKINSKK